MKTPSSALVTFLVVTAVGFALAQENSKAESKGYLSPSVGKHIESMATSNGGMVSITESAELPAEAKFNCNSEPGSIGVSFNRSTNPDDAKGLLMISDMMHSQVAAGQPVDGEKMMEISVDGARVFYSEKSEGCVESEHPSMKILTVTAFWIGSDRSAQIGTLGISLDSAKKYIHEVIEKAKALDVAKVKST